MRTTVRLLGHPLHAMLVVIPLGLLPVSFLFDLIGLGAGPSWFAVTFWMLFVGWVVALGAAVFGLIDWLGIESGTRAKRIGLWHGGLNVLMAGLFLVSWLVRLPAPSHPAAVAIVFSAIGTGLLFVTGWLGGELVDRMGVGVYPDASPNAPSSIGIARKPAIPR